MGALCFLIDAFAAFLKMSLYVKVCVAGFASATDASCFEIPRCCSFNDSLMYTQHTLRRKLHQREDGQSY